MLLYAFYQFGNEMKIPLPMKPACVKANSSHFYGSQCCKTTICWLLHCKSRIFNVTTRIFNSADCKSGAINARLVLMLFNFSRSIIYGPTQFGHVSIQLLQDQVQRECGQVTRRLDCRGRVYPEESGILRCLGLGFRLSRCWIFLLHQNLQNREGGLQICSYQEFCTAFSLRLVCGSKFV